MARIGDKEGEGQEAQEGSRGLNLCLRPRFDSIFCLFLTCTPTSHARDLWFSSLSDSCPPPFLMLVFHAFLSPGSVHHTSKVHRTLYPRSSSPSIIKYALRNDPHLF